MATLEVHDGKGRVERVKISRSDPVIFGSNPQCNVVLQGAGVEPVHGRIRWQDRRYKIDAGADVDGLEVNGKLVKTSTLYQGDEIRVGACRIFVISTEEATVAAGDDKTRVQAAPKAASGDPARPDPLKRQRPWKGSAPAGAPEEVQAAAVSTAAKTVSLKDRVRSVLFKVSGPPGQEKVVTSPIVIGMVVAFILLIFASVGLFRSIRRSNADNLYKKGMDSVSDSDYRNAVKLLDQFVAENAEDKRANKARVFREMANVKQFTGSSGASWENALQAEGEMYDKVGKLDEFLDEQNDLAEQIVKTAEGLADRSRAGADPEILKTAEVAVELVRKAGGKAAESHIGKSKITQKMTAAKESIKRAAVRKEGLAAIDAGLDAKNPAVAYSARDQLITAYPDMAADRDVISRLIKANDLISKGASFDPAPRPAQTTPQPDALGAATTLVLRMDPGSKPTGGSVVYARVDGLVFGLDAANGAPMWQTPVGSAKELFPVVVPGADPAILIVDVRHDELVRLDGKTGKLTWRQALGERVLDVPLILGNQIFQATPSGKLLVIDLASGSLRGTLNLGRRITRSPVAAESGEYLYLMADEDSMFILKRDPLSVASVEYIGHDAGSIAATPARVGRFLVIPENTGMIEGRWRVLVLDATGATAKLKQTLPVAGWTWQTPVSAGTVIWSVSDRNEVIAYSIGLYDAPEPFKPLATIVADNQPSGPAYPYARSDRELWLSAGKSGRYDLNPDAGTVATAWTLGQVGPALAPIQSIDKMGIFTHEATEGPGVTLWGVDPQNGAVRWRTTLGASWPVEVVPGKKDGALQTLGFNGELIAMTPENITAGGFIEQPLPKAGSFRLPSMGAIWLSCGETTVLFPSAKASQMIVRKGGKFETIDLPSPLGSRPIAWNGNVLLPGADGRVYLIDPLTGESVADPYVPRFDKAHRERWRVPAMIDATSIALADEEGHLRKISYTTVPRPRLAVTGETSLGQPILVDPASTGGAVIVATADGKIRSFSAVDLSAVATLDLATPRIFGPAAVGGYGFASEASGDVYVFSTEGKKLWSGKLPSSINETPAVRAGNALFLTRSGALESRGLTDGATAERLSLGFLPAGRPLLAGDRLIVPTGLGTLRPVIDEHTASTTNKTGD